MEKKNPQILKTVKYNDIILACTQHRPILLYTLNHLSITYNTNTMEMLCKWSLCCIVQGSKNKKKSLFTCGSNMIAFNIFNAQLVESTDVEPVDTESRLYMISIVIPAPAGQQLLCHCGKERMEFLIAQDMLSSRGGAQNSQED